MDREEIERVLFSAIETITRKVIQQEQHAQLIEAQVTRVDNFGDGVYYKYQGSEYLGYKIYDDAEYVPGDIVNVLISNNPNIRNFIIAKV